MRRKKSFLGQITGGLMFLVLLGIFLAVLRQFDWDFGATLTWLGQKAISFVEYIANYFSGLPTFRKLFAS